MKPCGAQLNASGETGSYLTDRIVCHLLRFSFSGGPFMQRKFSPFMILLALLLLVVLVSGCRQSPEQNAETAGVTPPTNQSPGSSPVSNEIPGPTPSEIVVQTALQPAIDPACLKNTGKFDLIAAPFPPDGLEQGMTHVFCVTGVPAGEMVTFILKSPDGLDQTFQTPSVDQGGVAIAVQPIAIGADAKPGEWTLIASYQDKKDSLRFDVRPATQPFIALTEPVAEDPDIIRVSVGGLQPNTRARFSIYRLQPGQRQDGVIESRGELLLENQIAVDATGRADLVLDVTGQPGGPYLLVLSPAGTSQQTNTVIHLPEQERIALALNIQRPEPVPVSNSERGTGPGLEGAQEPAAFTPEHLPPAPTAAEAGGGLPDSISVALSDANLPPCSPTTTPTVQLWPRSGEVGQWWYGCASGFTPGTPLRIDAVLGNGATTSFDLTDTNADGTKTFRWYSLPEEGSGDFSVSVSDLKGNKATIKWSITPARQPHLLIYPHVVMKDVGAQLSLVGFPQRSNVQLGIYRLDTPDQTNAATLVQKLTVATNKNGIAQQAFSPVNDLTPGVYMLFAQSSPAYHFAGIDTPATAIEFFSVGAPLPEKYEFYSLFVGREAKGNVAVGNEQQSAPITQPSQSVQLTVSEEKTKRGIPTTIMMPVDNSPLPSCPDATNDAPTICMMPSTTERATYVYMLMHGFKPGTQFGVTVTPPTGATVQFNVKANKDGIADGHWYVLNNERLGAYKVRIRGGGQTFDDSFTVTEATSPHVVVQPRSPQPGTSVIISLSGLKPNTTYLLARYRGSLTDDGRVQFNLFTTKELKTGKNGGVQASFPAKKDQKNRLLLAAVFETGNPQPLAVEVYSPGRELYLRYPFAWGAAD